MTRRRLLRSLLTLSLVAAARPVAAVMAPSGIDSRLTLEWQAENGRGGRPVITGYLYNSYDRSAINVRLLAETLDGTGQVIGRAIGFIPGQVPLKNRSFFSVPLQQSGASYRVSVTNFEWRDCGI